MPRVVGFLILSLLCFASPPGSAIAAPTWQSPEPLPADSVPLGGDFRSAWIDASGRAVLSMAGSPAHRFALRPLGGPLGAPQAFPATVGTSLPPRFAANAAGDVITWTAGRYAFMPAGGTAFGAPTDVPANHALVDVAMAPTGEAFALLTAPGAESSGHIRVIKVAFRPAGPGQTFDVGNAVVMTPAVGHDRAVGIGITMDADGGGAVLYESWEGFDSASAVMLQSHRAGSGAFSTPAPITGYAGVGGDFSRALDGTAVLMHRTGNGAAEASVRPPGGSFGPAAPVANNADGDISHLTVAAVSGGRAVAGWTETDSLGCASSTFGWRTAVSSGGAFTVNGSGPSTIPSRSRMVAVRAAGANVAVATEAVTDPDGDACATNNDELVTLGVHNGTLGGATATATIESSVVRSNGAVARPSMTAFAAGPSGHVLIGSFLIQSHSLTAYEDRAGLGGGGGDEPDPVPEPPPGPPAPPPENPQPPPPEILPGPPARPTAPAAIVLRGPVVARRNVASVPFSCTSAQGACRTVVRLFGVGGGARAAATRLLGSARATVPAGARRTIRVKLNRTGRRATKRSGRLRIRIDAVVTVAGQKTTLRRRATLVRR